MQLPPKRETGQAVTFFAKKTKTMWSWHAYSPFSSPSHPLFLTPPPSYTSSYTMAWLQYVDDNLVGSGIVEKAAILGLDNSLWATSAVFKIGDTNAKKLIAACRSDNSDVVTNDLYL